MIFPKLYSQYRREYIYLLQLIVERYSYCARAQDRSSVPGCPRRDELSVIAQAEGARLASSKFRFGEHNDGL